MYCSLIYYRQKIQILNPLFVGNFAQNKFFLKKYTILTFFIVSIFKHILFFVETEKMLTYLYTFSDQKFLDCNLYQRKIAKGWLKKGMISMDAETISSKVRNSV